MSVIKNLFTECKSERQRVGIVNATITPHCSSKNYYNNRGSVTTFMCTLNLATQSKYENMSYSVKFILYLTGQPGNYIYCENPAFDTFLNFEIKYNF